MSYMVTVNYNYNFLTTPDNITLLLFVRNKLTSTKKILVNVR